MCLTTGTQLEKGRTEMHGSLWIYHQSEGCAPQCRIRSTPAQHTRDRRADWILPLIVLTGHLRRLLKEKGLLEDQPWVETLLQSGAPQRIQSPF